MSRKVFDVLTMGMGYLPSKLVYKLKKWNVYSFINNAYELVEESAT